MAQAEPGMGFGGRRGLLVWACRHLVSVQVLVSEAVAGRRPADDAGSCRGVGLPPAGRLSAAQLRRGESQRGLRHGELETGTPQNPTHTRRQECVQCTRGSVIRMQKEANVLDLQLLSRIEVAEGQLCALQSQVSVFVLFCRDSRGIRPLYRSISRIVSCRFDDVANSTQIEHLDSKEAWNAEYLSLPAEVHPRNGSRHLLCVAGLLLSLPVATTRRIVEAGMTSRINFEEMCLALFALLNSKSGVVSANAALFQ
jgi:hypothetical protein